MPVVVTLPQNSTLRSNNETLPAYQPNPPTNPNTLPLRNDRRSVATLPPFVPVRPVLPNNTVTDGSGGTGGPTSLPSNNNNNVPSQGNGPGQYGPNNQFGTYPPYTGPPYTGAGQGNTGNNSTGTGPTQVNPPTNQGNQGGTAGYKYTGGTRFPYVTVKAPGYTSLIGKSAISPIVNDKLRRGQAGEGKTAVSQNEVDPRFINRGSYGNWVNVEFGANLIAVFF